MMMNTQLTKELLLSAFFKLKGRIREENITFRELTEGSIFYAMNVRKCELVGITVESLLPIYEDDRSNMILGIVAKNGKRYGVLADERESVSDYMADVVYFSCKEAVLHYLTDSLMKQSELVTCLIGSDTSESTPIIKDLQVGDPIWQRDIDVYRLLKRFTVKAINVDTKDEDNDTTITLSSGDIICLYGNDPASHDTFDEHERYRYYTNPAIAIEEVRRHQIAVNSYLQELETIYEK